MFSPPFAEISTLPCDEPFTDWHVLIPEIVPYEKFTDHVDNSVLYADDCPAISGSKTMVTISGFAHNGIAKTGIKNAKIQKQAKYSDFFIIKTPQISDTYIMNKTYVFDIVVKLKNKN